MPFNYHFIYSNLTINRHFVMLLSKRRSVSQKIDAIQIFKITTKRPCQKSLEFLECTHKTSMHTQTHIPLCIYQKHGAKPFLIVSVNKNFLRNIQPMRLRISQDSHLQKFVSFEVIDRLFVFFVNFLRE